MDFAESPAYMDNVELLRSTQRPSILVPRLSQDFPVFFRGGGIQIPPTAHAFWDAVQRSNLHESQGGSS